MAEDREATVARGRRAAELLDDELLKAAFEQLERGYYDAWRATALSDQTGREKLFLAANVVGKVREHLTTVLNDGKIAATELRRVAEEEARKKRFGII